MWKVPAIFVAALLMTSIVTQGNFAFAEPQKPDKYAPDKLLIKFKKNVSKEKQNSILKNNDVFVISEVSPLDIKILKVPPHALDKVKSALSKKIDVAYVENDYMFEPTVIPNDPKYSSPWWLDKINAPGAWDINQEIGRAHV